MIKSPASSVPARPRRAIMELMKTRGPAPAAELAVARKVSAMAVRQHLYALQEQKLVTYEEAVRGVGRPQKLWRLTPRAERHFPDAHAELAVALLDGVKSSFGMAGLEKLLTLRTDRQVADYAEQLAGLRTLGAKVRALARLRSNEGYMAEAGRDEDGTWLLIENHCPVCSAAKTCAGLCQTEFAVFQAVLGLDVSLERSEHILAGARRCVYRIKAGGLAG